MKKLLFLLAFLPSLTIANDIIMRPYGIATTVVFKLYDVSTGGLNITSVDGGAEVTVHCDNDAGTTANADFQDEGSYYSLALTAAEMSCQLVVLDINAEDREVVIIETYGHPSSQHPQL